MKRSCADVVATADVVAAAMAVPRVEIMVATVAAATGGAAAATQAENDALVSRGYLALLDPCKLQCGLWSRGIESLHA